MRKYPTETTKGTLDWGEPRIFGAADGQDAESFAETGLQLAQRLSLTKPPRHSEKIGFAAEWKPLWRPFDASLQSADPKMAQECHGKAKPRRIVSNAGSRNGWFHEDERLGRIGETSRLRHKVTLGRRLAQGSRTFTEQGQQS